MTAKQEASELVSGFMKLIPKDGFPQEVHKECALMCAINTINTLLELEPKVDEDLWLYRELKAKFLYWQDVKEEIKKL